MLKMSDRLPHSQDGSPLSANCIRDNDSLVIHMPVEITPLWREVPVPMQMTGIIIHSEGSHNFPAAMGNAHNETCSALVKVGPTSGGSSAATIRI